MYPYLRKYINNPYKILVDGFNKAEDKFCNKRYGNYSTLLSAIEACREDNTCQMIYDDNCDETGTFELCRNVQYIETSSIGILYKKSCVYQKGKN